MVRTGSRIVTCGGLTSSACPFIAVKVGDSSRRYSKRGRQSSISQGPIFLSGSIPERMSSWRHALACLPALKAVMVERPWEFESLCLRSAWIASDEARGYPGSQKAEKPPGLGRSIRWLATELASKASEPNGLTGSIPVPSALPRWLELVDTPGLEPGAFAAWGFDSLSGYYMR